MKKIYLFLATLILLIFSDRDLKAQFIFSPPCGAPPSGFMNEQFGDAFVPRLPAAAGAFVNNVTIPGWYLSNPAVYRGGNNGGAGTGGFYAYNNGNSDMTLGFLTTGAVPLLRAGIRIRNNYGTPIYGLLLAMRGEQWRKGANGNNENRIRVEYQVKTGGVPADNVNDPGVWTPVVTDGGSEMDFVAPNDSATCGSGGRNLDGDQPANLRNLPAVFGNMSLNVTLMPGEEMMIRFTNEFQTCSGHGMGIDDLVIVPIVDAPIPNTNSVGPLNVCANSTATYTITPQNGVRYTWSFIDAGPNIIPPITGPSVTVDYAGVMPGTYRLRLTPEPNPANMIDPGCQSSTTPLDIPIEVSSGTPAPVLDEPNSILCYEPSTIVSANAVNFPFTGEWTIITGSPGSTITNGPVDGQATLSGIDPAGFTYILRYTITGPGCAPNFADMTLQVLPQPVLPNAGTDIFLCDVPNVTLTGNIPNGDGEGSWIFQTGPMMPTITSPGPPGNVGNVTGMNFPGTYRFRYQIDYPTCSQTFFDDVDVTVVPLITANPTFTAQLCNATSTLLTGNNPAPGTGIWVIISQPPGGTATLNPPTSITPILSGMIPGNYRLQYTITNSPCPVSSQQIDIVNGPPLPVADAGLDQDLCATVSTAIVNGNNFPNGAGGLWSFVSGPAAGTVTTVGTQGNISGLTVPGEYVFRWTISGGGCTPETDDVSIFIVPQPTVANAGTDFTVCQSPNFTVTGNIPVNGTGSWSVVSAPGTLTNLTNIPPNQALISNPLPGNYVLRYTITNAPCTPSTDDVTVTVLAPPTVANAGRDTVLCNQTSYTLTGNAPTVGTPAWSVVAGPNTPIIVQAGPNANASGLVPGTYTFTYTITNGICPPSQDNVTVRIDPATVGGTVSGPGSVCQPGNNLVLNLTGQVGDILRWESSTNNFGSITTINNTTSTLVVPVVSTTTSFRAVVRSGVCTTLVSSVRTVQVLPAPIPGTLASNISSFDGCSDSNFGTLTLTGYSGNIIRWESSQDNFVTVTTINNTQPTYNFNNLNGASSFRVVVGNGACPNVLSNVVTISVRQGPILTINDLSIAVGCNGRATITAFARSGRPPYTYWINPANGSMAPFGVNGAVFSNVVPGTYTMYVRDANMCYSSVVFTTGNQVTPPAVRQINGITNNRASIFWATVAPGVGVRYNLRYSTNANGPWTVVNNITATNRTLTNLLASTTYFLQLQTVCQNNVLSAWSTNSSFITLNNREEISAQTITSFTAAELYPNPNGGTFTLSFDSDAEESYVTEVYDLSGKVIFREEKVAQTGRNQSEIRLENASKGIYLLRIRTADRYHASVKVVVQ